MFIVFSLMFTLVFPFRPLPDGGGTPDTDVQNTCKVRYKFPQFKEFFQLFLLNGE